MDIPLNFGLVVLALNWKQTAKDQGWSAALSIGTKDKQSTIASFSVPLTGKDDDHYYY